MIYGFAYLGMVIAISAGWLVLAVLKKPDFIEKPIDKLKNKLALIEEYREWITEGIFESNALYLIDKR